MDIRLWPVAEPEKKLNTFSVIAALVLLFSADFGPLVPGQEVRNAAAFGLGEIRLALQLAVAFGVRPESRLFYDYCATGQ